MIRNLLAAFIQQGISRRQFISSLVGLGVSSAAARSFGDTLTQADTKSTLALRDASGGAITCETLRAWGVEYVFGNTGAYEAGFVDALVDYPDIHYLLGLQEGSVVAMADGYARATGNTAFVNVHSITGTANALGLIVNAFADSSPIVVTAGFSETGAENRGVFTETPKLEDIPGAFAKLSVRAGRTDVLAETLRRAFQLATTLPSGPVYLGVPADVWQGKIDHARLIGPQRSLGRGRVAPDPELLAQAVDALAAANNPLLIAGAELPRWGGLAELLEIADQLSATVSGDTASSRSSMGFPSQHPRYLGPLRRPIHAPQAFDVVLLAGASRLSLARGPHPLIPTDARIIEFGIREDHLARGYPVDILIYAHPQATLQALRDGLKKRKLDSARISARRAMGEKLKQQRSARLAQRLQQVWNESPIAPERLAAEIDRALARDAVVVTEGVTSDSAMQNYIHFDQVNGGRRHFISSGGSLGWGVGAALGVKLGLPASQVVLLLGDGAFQFATQALWSAKRYAIPVTVVIFNNHAYQANRFALARMQGRAMAESRFIGIDIDDPDIDHAGIGRSYGIDGERVIRGDDLPAALKRGLQAQARGHSYLLDVHIARRGPGAQVHWKESFKLTKKATP